MLLAFNCLSPNLVLVTWVIAPAWESYLFFIHLLNLSAFGIFPSVKEEYQAAPSLFRFATTRCHPTDPSLTSSLSLTSALSASIVLSSRLPTTSHVFSFILLSVLLFSGWPNIAKGVRESGKIWSIGLTGSMALLAFSFLPGYEDLGLGGDTCGVLFLGILGVVGLVGPLGVWVGWRWKTVRGGGWDAAKVTLKRRASMQR